MADPEVVRGPTIEAKAIRLVNFIGDLTDAPTMLRKVADRIEETDAVLIGLIGLWNVGFADPWQLNLQVVLDCENDEEAP